MFTWIRACPVSRGAVWRRGATESADRLSSTVARAPVAGHPAPGYQDAAEKVAVDPVEPSAQVLGGLALASDLTGDGNHAIDKPGESEEVGGGVGWRGIKYHEVVVLMEASSRTWPWPPNRVPKSGCASGGPFGIIDNSRATWAVDPARGRRMLGEGGRDRPSRRARWSGPLPLARRVAGQSGVADISGYEQRSPARLGERHAQFGGDLAGEHAVVNADHDDGAQTPTLRPPR